MIKKITYLILFLCLTHQSFGQQKMSLQDVSKKLDVLAQTKKSLNEPMRIDLSGLTLYDFLNTIAEEHQLNMSVDSRLNQIVSSNFYDIKVKDVILFLIKTHHLEVRFINTIIVFEPETPKPKVELPKPLKKIDVSYNEKNNFLSVKLKNDSLPRVAEAITDASNKNIVLSPDIKTQKVSSYVLNRPFNQVIEMMAKSNGLVLTVDENDNYFLEKNNIPKEENTTSNSKITSRSRNKSKRLRSKGNNDFDIALDTQGFLQIQAFEADATTLITEAANLLNLSFFMYDTPKEVNTTLIAKGLTFENLLEHLLKGEKYTYKVLDDVYFIGEHTTKGMRSTELVQLENRTIETVLSSLPKALTQELEIKEFVELNGFVVSGSKGQIQEFKDYIHTIDLVVPNVQIEVIIVQYQKSHDVQTGLRAILDSENTNRPTAGTVFPSTDLTLNAHSVNNLIDAFNGLGIINLGKVTENFYMNLSALENNSLIKVSSTPKLVTLNGHDAISSIGETSYYFEQNNKLISNGINDNILQSGTWKTTEANLSINITPTVSKDEHVTLVINVERSSFLARVGENAPPGKATQKFESEIRVKNNEMILLGGLDELENEKSGTGTPLLSRIPVINWFFSSRKKRKEKSKLHIFIKPTVTY
jgi:type IV pilus assembly protein PilQ